MRTVNRILVIIQRSNGDVFLSAALVKALYVYYQAPSIDLLINDDTFAVAKLVPNITNIYTFSYQQKKEKRWLQERKLITKIFKKYDLTINLTSSDRSVVYALLSSRQTISAIEVKRSKSWWKKLLLKHYYYFDNSKHILVNNLKPLDLLKIKSENTYYEINLNENALLDLKNKLTKMNINRFIIFHPSTQYNYKVYPQKLRDRLLIELNKLGIPILVTGGNNKIDIQIKKSLPKLENIYDFIGKTSLEEFFVLSKLSLCYVGMDTLNMHIAASQNKRIFAIFGPTNLKMWSPWSNQLKRSAVDDKPMQTYGNITLFQGDLPCVACGKAGCDDNHGVSVCLEKIKPEVVSNEIKQWLSAPTKDSDISVLMK